jgi:capsular exopolysaccharide synthesis family protein
LGRKKRIPISHVYLSESPEATEFRRVLHNIGKSAQGGEKRTVLITSAMLSEGKSLVSSFMAMTSARHKKRKTLLIDFDLRRPSQHRLFACDRAKGISDIILDQIPPRDVIKQSEIDGLDLLTAGKAVDNPADILTGPNIHAIIEEMKFYYEFIVVDSPPLIPVMDSLILLEELDAVILVVKAGSTQKAVVSRARKALASHNGKVVGVIVNNLDRTLPYYYNYGYYGYHSTSQGK